MAVNRGTPGILGWGGVGWEKVGCATALVKNVVSFPN